MKKKTGGKRKGTRSLKKTSAWKWFSLYIRQRDNWICVTCGDRYRPHDQRLHAGHYMQAFGGAGTFFNEKNVNAQCAHCNGHMQGEQHKHGKYINKKYGKGATEELRKLFIKSREAYHQKELKEISDKYRAKYRELGGNK